MLISDVAVTPFQKIAVLWPLRLVSTASRLVTRLLPTPPLPLTTAITFFTLLNAFCASSRLSGLLRDAQSAPQLEQSCVHSDNFLTSNCFFPYLYGFSRFLPVRGSPGWPPVWD